MTHVFQRTSIRSSPQHLLVSPSFWCHSSGSGLIWPGSAPRVGAVLEVVVLELDLVFDLVDQNLRQEDADQLQKRKHKQRAHQLDLTVSLYS